MLVCDHMQSQPSWIENMWTFSTPEASSKTVACKCIYFQLDEDCAKSIKQNGHLSQPSCSEIFLMASDKLPHSPLKYMGEWNVWQNIGWLSILFCNRGFQVISLALYALRSIPRAQVYFIMACLASNAMPENSYFHSLQGSSPASVV